jgi:OFA family oxalate/formate antiporter-like MFS transporter
MKITVNRWVMLAAHVLINFVLGGVYAFSFFKTPLMAQYHWDPALLALAFSINMGIIPIPMIIGGAMIDKGHGKLAIVLGGILFSLGFILSGFVKTLPMLLLTYGLLAGIGSGLAFTGNLNNAIKFFPDKRGLASGCVLAGVGIGTLLCTALAKYFLSIMDISNSLLCLGIVYLVVLFVVQFFIKSAPAKNSGGVASSPMDKDWKAMLADNRFWIMFCVMAIGVFSGMVISSSSAQIGMGQFGLAGGAVIVSLVSIFNSVGRLIWGTVSDLIGEYNTLTLVYIMMALLMGLLLISNGNTVTFYISALGIGFAYAGVLTIFPSITSSNFGLRNQGLNYAFIYFGFAIGAVIAPYVTSYMFKITKTFNSVFIMSIILLIVGVGLIHIIRLKYLKAKRILENK